MKNDARVKEFLQNRDLAPKSVLRYLEVFRLYTLYTGLTPAELIDEAEAEEISGILPRKRKIKTRLIGFRDFLYSRDYSEFNIKNTMSTIRSFYSDFEINLPKSKVNRKYQNKKTIDDIPTMDHIRKVLSYANLKYKAIILLQLSSGMGSAEIRSLSYNDFLRSLKDYYETPTNTLTDIEEITNILNIKEKNNEVIVGTWYITRIKTKMPYFTFNTSESIKTILEYLQYSPPKGPESPLFRTKIDNEEELSEQAILHYFNRLNKKCGFGKIGKAGFFHSHVLRSFYASTLYKLKIPELVVQWMLGHQIPPVTEAYFKADPDALRNQYIDCIPELTLEDTEIITIKSEQVIEMEKERANDRERIKNLEIALKVIEDLNKE